MKKLLAVWSSIILLVLCLCPSVFAATGSLSISATTTSVVVGNKVTVNITYSGNNNPIAAIQSSITYDANKLQLDLTASSGPDGAALHGDAGATYAIFSMPASGKLPTSVTFKLVFKSIATGSNTVKVVTEEFLANDANYSSLGSPSKSITITASNPSLSGDATLKELRPTKGTLVPKFDKNVTEYTVSVPYTVTRGLLVFDPTDPNAQSVVTENADLKVGKNTRIITVTAPNGTTKKYTVVFIREPQQSTTSGTGTTTTLPPVSTTPEVEVNGVLMDVAVAQPSVRLPAGFTWDFITLGDQEVSAAMQDSGDLVLLYLLDKESTTGALYIYDAAADTFSLFRQITGTGATYVLHDLPDSEVSPLGTVTGTVTIGEQTATAYLYEDPALTDYAIVYLTAADGVSGYYTYDATDGSLQRYHTVTVEREPDTGVNLPPSDHTAQTESKTNPVVEFFATYQQVILLGAAACVGLAILIIVIVWIAAHSGGNKGKH